MEPTIPSGEIYLDYMVVNAPCGNPTELVIYSTLLWLPAWRCRESIGHVRLSSSKVQRGEEVLNRAVATGELSECGMKAVLAAVDPFHDKPIDGLRGYPDQETGPSVIRHWSSSTTIKAKDAGGALLVYSQPILDQSTIYSCTRRNAVVDSISVGVSTNAVLSPVSMYNFTNAQATAVGGLPFAPVESFHHAIPDSYFQDGPCRLLGMGFEIHDVTAEIYKQGTISCFEVPQSTADKETAFVVAQTIGGVAYVGTPVEICRLQRYPSSLDEIMMYPGSVQWDAKDGAYVVIPFTGHENPPVLAEYRTPLLNTTPSSVMDATDTLNTTARYLGAYASGGVAGDPFVFNAHAYAPMNSRGALITGLNAESTFTITTRFYFECFPVQSSPLQTLAAPSCSFDPKALALISLMMRSMPVAVPVKDNPLGEWFWESVEAALPVLGTVASTLFPEFSPLIAAGSAMGTKYAAEKNAKRKKKKIAAAEQLLAQNRRKTKPLPPLPPVIKQEVKQVAKSEAQKVAGQNRQQNRRGRR